MTNDIETLKALRDDESVTAQYGDYDESDDQKRERLNRVAALTRTIARLEAMDAAKGDERIDRGYAQWVECYKAWCQFLSL